MKLDRAIIAAISVLILMSLPSCDNKGIQKGNTMLYSWFDDLGFVEGLDQNGYFELLESCSIEGKTLTEVAPYTGFNGQSISGFSGSCMSFSYGQEFSSGRNSVIVSYLAFSEDIDGASLPYGLKLGCNLTTVLSAFGYEDMTQEVIEENVKDSGVWALKEEIGEHLVLRDMTVNESETGYLYPWELIYTEEYSAVRSDGRSSTVKRSLKLYFSQGSSPVLKQASITLSEEY